MLTIRYASDEDKKFWFSIDGHLDVNEFLLKMP